MKVWWCGKCKVAGLTVTPLHRIAHADDIREMQLVPADALVIQKENGKWPSWTKEERWSDTSTPPKRRHTLVVFLDVPHD